jgi:hypothetical protein
MRATTAVFVLWLGLGLGLPACSNAENAGAEAARRQAAAEQQAKGEKAAPAKRMATPVAGQTRLPCSQLIDAAAFQTALGEKEPLTVKDVTRSEADATSSCSLVRGGKRPNEAAQQALLKKGGKLGVMAGDELCNVTAFCSTIEEPERFKAACKARKEQDDDSLGSYACVRVVAVGADDVKVFQLLDEDTRCVLRVRGGPSNVDNDLIRSCAKAARDSIGPAQIRVDGAPATGSAG